MKKNLKRSLLIFSVTAAAALSLAACGQKHVHTFEEGWTSDSENHWHESSCGHDVKDGLAKHKFTENVTKQATCTEEGSATYTCEDCKYSYTATLPTVDHTYDTAHWMAGAFTHWHACSVCGDKNGETEHTFVQGVCSACNATEDAMYAALYVFEENGDDYVVAGLTTEGAARAKLTVPALYNGKSVISIKANAFEKSAATEVTILASVTAIEKETFMNCTALKKVVLPDTVEEIKDTAFAGCAALTDINLPSGLTSIGWFAFDGCAALEGIELPAGLTSLGKQAFANCTSLKEIDVPAGITKIADRLFYNCTALGSVTLAGEITDIGIYAFADCTSLTSFDLPDTLKFIGQGAFMGSGLMRVNVPDSVTTLSVEAFASCYSLTEAILPGNLIRHYGKIFADCSALEEIEIPFVGSNVNAADAITTKFGYLFGVSVPKDESAFTKVGDYYIPNSLTIVTVTGGTIADGAFDGCAHLVTVHVEENVVLNAVEFADCTATIHVLGAPKLSEISLVSSAYANEAVDLTYQATYGSVVEIVVKKGSDEAVSGTDYVFNAAKTQITFKTEATFTVTVKATLNNLTAEKSASVEVSFRGPELENVALDKTSINQTESVVLSYSIDSESQVTVTVKKGETAAVEGSDYTYDAATKTYTFNVAGTYTITVSALRNGKTVERTLTVAVADTSVTAPVVTLTASESSVEEGTAVTLSASVAYDTEHEDSKNLETYEVFVQSGSEFVNADESFYEFGENHATFKPFVAGTYRVTLTANSTKGQTASNSVTITATRVEITLVWTTQATSNGWLRYALEGGDIIYTVTGYAGGYEINYTVDNAVVSAGALSSGTGVHVSSTEVDTATVKVTYTHKSETSITKSLEMPVSFVSDLVNAPVLGEDPFGGTYGTLIPSTGLMLYFAATDKDGVALTYNEISYEVVEVSLTKDTNTAITKDDVKIGKVCDDNDHPYVIVQNFENNTAHGTVTLKLTATKDGATAAATKVFTVKTVGRDNKGLNDYANAVFTNGIGAADLENIISESVRQNAVISKEGIIYHRDAGAWNYSGQGAANLLVVKPNGANNYQVDFDYTIVKRRESNNKASFCVNYRTGNYETYNGSQNAFYVENTATTITAGYWGEENGKTQGTGPEAVIWNVIKVRFTHTVADNVVTFKWQWSADGETYNDWLTYTIASSTTNGNMGAPVYGMQFNHEDGCFRIGNVTLTNLDA